MVDPREVRYLAAIAERKRFTDAVIESNSHRKIVVAGPGTGKTHLFKEILKRKANGLTLTFINALVEDLSLELNGISQVKTLHGFARGLIASGAKAEIRMFRALPEIIEDDAKILGRAAVKYEPMFFEMTIEGDDLAFYKARKDYYGYYGFCDVIYGAVKLLEKYESKIPIFDQIVVDEFQDFNLLEVSLIDTLAKRSPILLAGDDDQALYDFKRASSGYIRDRYSDKFPDHEPFNLPFCSRCTKVIVEAVNDIVRGATRHGLLVGRIEKPYLYFDCEEKDRECEKHPKISYARMQARQIPWFIEKSLKEVAADLKRPFSALVISPAGIHLRDITNSLRAKGLTNIIHAGRVDTDNVQLLDGLKILLDDYESNLGWRIAAKCCVLREQFAAAIERSTKEGSSPFSHLIPPPARTHIRKLVAILRRVRDEKLSSDDQLDLLLDTLKRDAREIAIKDLKDQIVEESFNFGSPEIRKIPIRMSTVQGSKGLAEDYVFITHFEDQYFLETDARKKKVVTDQSIYKFLVALTRARKKVFLISSNPYQDPTFLDWISKERIDLVFQSAS